MTDICVIGGGIVGLATAYELLQQCPDAKIVVVEKESDAARHQSGRNSGVLHSGIYYKPGSLKAKTCRAGKTAMQEFCNEHDVPFDLCGKVIVATDESELQRLDNIQTRGSANEVICHRVDAAQLKELEPHVRGVAALHVPAAGIVDYATVCRTLVRLIRAAGHEVRFDFEVKNISQTDRWVELKSNSDSITAQTVINCAGLYSDRILRLAGVQPAHRIVPFRGEYYKLHPEHRRLCRNLIYPVPDPAFPFLGVHLTRMIDGTVECGPNAVLALAREGYNWRTINSVDLAESILYTGFQKLALAHWKMGAGEIWRSFSKRAFVKALQKLVPEIRTAHVSPCRAGVRAQALGPDGKMLDDFQILKQNRIIHVLNAPSPAATASIQIGKHIVSQLTPI